MKPKDKIAELERSMRRARRIAYMLGVIAILVLALILYSIGEIQ